MSEQASVHAPKAPTTTVDGTEKAARRWSLDGVETGVKVGMVAAIAGAGLAASFTHMHDWTIQHMPAGTPSWFGWANAVISELIPIAAFLTIRRRLVTGQPYGYPVVLLLAGAALSLTAQLAAVGSAASWSARFLAILPALAFMALSKMVLSDLDAAHKHAATVAAEDARQAEVIRELEAKAADAAVRALQAETAIAVAEERRATELVASATRLREMEERLRKATVEAPRVTSAKPTRKSTEAAPKAPRKTGAELLEERVEAAKESLPLWQIETPSGPEVASALGLKSEGVISDVRKRLTADRLALPAGHPH